MVKARKATELVPRYLARVPLDPFSNGQPLRYKNQPKRFVASQTYERIVEPSPPTLLREVRHYQTLPFTLYSIGHNARDDGGAPYQDQNQSDMTRRYMVDYLQSTSIPADIVAGINN